MLADAIGTEILQNLAKSSELALMCPLLPIHLTVLHQFMKTMRQFQSNINCFENLH